MIIKVLGAGCSNCSVLEKNTQEAVQQLRLDARVIKVTDIQSILTYGVISFPALVIDEQVVMYGQNPTVDELKELLLNHKK